MNFYDYIADGEVIENEVYAAACDLIKNGLQVIPIIKGKKRAIEAVKDMSKLRANPINEHNVAFYFDGRDVEIGLMLRQNMEVIDVDAKNQPSLYNDFLYAFEMGWPDLYEKMVISKTPNGGLHFLYRSEIIGGEKQIARIPGSTNPLTIIEKISESQNSFIKCAPSEGYEFIQGNPMEIQYITAEERNWICALSAGFNKIHKPEVKQKEAEREDSPWNVYNGQNDWTYILKELTDRGWSELQDRNDKVVLQRPGETKQHSAYLWKDSNSLYVMSGSTELLPEKPYSPFGIYCHFYHDGNIAHACQALAKEGIGKNIYEEGQFWIRENKKIAIKYTELTLWITSIGYRLYNSQLVKITNNVVSIVDERQLKQAFLNEMEYHMVDYFYDKVSAIFNDKGGVMSMIEEIDISKFIIDTSAYTWLFFANYAVQISANETKTIQYHDLDGYIWQGSIIDRNFYNMSYDGCDAERFVNILGGDHADKLRMILGYCLSRYKDPINPRAVVLTEDIDPENEGGSHGGSGKGLLFAFIRKFRKVTDIDGKNFKSDNNFAWQSVDPDTNIIFVDDLEKRFKFTSLFSILTGSLSIEKKHMKAITIPFELAPKVFLTSNYSVGDMDISTERRKYEFSVVKYFGPDREPIDEFKREFFTGWDIKEWMRFDNFMAECAREYIAYPDKKDINNRTKNSIERSLVANTSPDFIEYMDDQLKSNFFDFAPLELKNFAGYVNGQYISNGVNVELYNQNMSRPEYYLVKSKEDLLDKMRAKTSYKGLSTIMLTKWFSQWAKSRGVEVDTAHKKANETSRFYRIISWDPLQHLFSDNMEFEKPKDGIVGIDPVTDDNCPF